MRGLRGSLVPGILAALQLAGLGLPCAPVASEPASGHALNAETQAEHAHHAQASQSEQSAPGDLQHALVLKAGCPCGCTGGTELAAPTRNLGDALLLDEPETFARRAPVTQTAGSLSAPPPPLRRIEHVPLQFG